MRSMRTPRSSSTIYPHMRPSYRTVSARSFFLWNKIGFLMLNLNELFAPSADVVARTYVNAQQYEEMYARSINDPEGFWAEHAKRIDWIKPFSKVKNTSFSWPDISIKWFEDGELNVAANCIDRHLE